YLLSRLCATLLRLIDTLFIHPHLSSPFSLHHTAPTEIYTLSLHDALPISCSPERRRDGSNNWLTAATIPRVTSHLSPMVSRWKRDRKSTRLNSSHGSISYAVFCLKKKKMQTSNHIQQNPGHVSVLQQD